MPKFITFEGLDFSGKSTTLNAIKDKLLANHDIIFTREPGGSPLAEQIRDLLTTHAQEYTPEQKLELFSMARLDHVTNTIDPALRNGKSVISDRYNGSTYAYQVGGDGLAFDKVQETTNYLYSTFPRARPDLTIYFKVSPQERKRRMSLRDQDALDKYDELFYQRVEKAYLQGIQASSKMIEIINADAEPDIIAHKVYQIIEKALQKES